MLNNYDIEIKDYNYVVILKTYIKIRSDCTIINCINYHDTQAFKYIKLISGILIFKSEQNMLQI